MPLATVDAVGVFGEVDDRPGFDFVVEDHREVPRERRRFFAADRADRARLAALGDLTGDFVEGIATLVGEAEGDDRFVELPVGLFGIGDLVPVQRRVVFEHEPARLGGFVGLASFVDRQFRDEDVAGGDFDDDPSLGIFPRSG